ncbi:MAG: hypothetical protein Dbin4_02050, partial [Alphaproteobacteria bacterium]|nr:hypothetical protein [Alphaproteobacteria bacterium]
GWAAKGLGERLGRMLDEQRKAKDIRDFLEKIYNGVGTPREDLSQINDQEIVELAENLRAGVPVATPVFDGAQESEIRGLLALAGLNETGQVYLR